MDEPTAEMCNGRTRIKLTDGRTGYATWYPQMGGYVGKALVAIDDDGCFDVWVWHDGDFPFAAEVPEYTGASYVAEFGPSGTTVRTVEEQVPAEHNEPRLLHHCSPGQFISFGQQMLAFAEEPDRG